MQNTNQHFRAIFCTETRRHEVVDQLLQFRKRLFVDALQWDLPVRDGRERDRFDTGSTVHCAMFRNDNLLGGFRAIRTDERYLAESDFPRLASIAPYPRRQDAWEISRFGVLQSDGTSVHAQILYALMLRFAHDRKASTLVAVTDLRHERFLGQIGIRTRRYGAPLNMSLDDKGEPLLLVAGEIPVALQRGSRFKALLKSADDVEIIDETLVLGPERLSA